MHFVKQNTRSKVTSGKVPFSKKLRRQITHETRLDGNAGGLIYFSGIKRMNEDGSR